MEQNVDVHSVHLLNTTRGNVSSDTTGARVDSHCGETESFPVYLQRQKLARRFPPSRVTERENRLLAL